MIRKNAVKCLNCQEEVESKHRHDFRTCKCGNVSVDGGKDYLRRAYKEETLFEDISEEYSFSIDGILLCLQDLSKKQWKQQPTNFVFKVYIPNNDWEIFPNFHEENYHINSMKNSPNYYVCEFRILITDSDAYLKMLSTNLYHSYKYKYATNFD